MGLDDMACDDMTLSFRDKGDQARDAGDFAGAAAAYETHLADHPEDAAIWVQRGNCLKECGALALAVKSYEASLRLRPDDADAYVQLGHAHKLNGRIDLAVRSYERANQIDPGLASAARELVALGRTPAAPLSPLAATQAADKTALLIDVTDLLLFLDANMHLTGIQRVQAGVLFNLRDLKKDFSLLGSAPALVVPVYVDPKSGEMRALDFEALRAVTRRLSDADLTREALTQALEDLRLSAAATEPREGDLYVVLGAFWLGPRYVRGLREVKAAGARIGLFVHDLIPLTHPQFVADVTREAVTDQLADVLLLCDFVLASCDHVAREVAVVLENELGRLLPIGVMPLAHVPGFEQDDEAANGGGGALRPPPEYVLTVGTIEGRKNHAFLIEAWERLSESLHDALPPLVIVGKWGWRVEHVKERLERSGYLGGRVIVYDKVSDADLTRLYDNCLFTVFPSFAEGWGLPVGESLAHGRPCVASNTTSIPAVGGAFCRYFNPNDVGAGVALIQTLLQDRAELARWTKEVRETFRPRLWRDVAERFFDLLAQMRPELKAAPARRQPAELLAGSLYPLGAAALNREPWTRRAAKFVFGAGWHDLENWGCWSARPRAELSFRAVGAREGAHARVWLRLTAPPGGQSATKIACARSGREQIVQMPPAPHRVWAQVDAAVGPDGEVRLRVERLRPSQLETDKRGLFCGVCDVGHYASDDLDARLSLLEAIVSRPHAS